MFAEDRNDPLRRFAIPKRRTLGRTRGIAEDGSCRRKNAIRIHSYNLIRAVLNRCRAFRVLAQRKAGHAEHGGFFLDAAGIGEHDARPVVE